MSIATFGALTAEQRTFYEMEMLDRAVPAFLHLNFGLRGFHPVTQVPEHAGATINWRVFGAFTAVTTPLTEGVTPNPEEIAITADTATVSEYGAYVRYTKKLAIFGMDMVASEAADALGEQAGDSLDQITRAIVIAGTTVQFASTATQRTEITAAMVLSALELLEGLTTLKVNNAKPIMDGLYPVLIHPYTEYDLMKDTTLASVFNYAIGKDSKSPWLTGYVGDALGYRFFSTSNAIEWVDGGLSNADVFAALVFGKGSFGIGGIAAYLPTAAGIDEPLSNESNNTFGGTIRPLKLIDKPFGSSGADDPLEQRASIAWYTTYVAKILRQPFMLRIEHGTTLGS